MLRLRQVKSRLLESLTEGVAERETGCLAPCCRRVAFDSVWSRRAPAQHHKRLTPFRCFRAVSVGETDVKIMPSSGKSACDPALLASRPAQDLQQSTCG